MKPIGPLMKEHRLIERLVNILSEQLTPTSGSQMIDPQVIAVAVDFFHTYADRTHHGKEEDILFRELAKKQLSLNDNKTMQELIEEHKLARKMVTELSEANKRYVKGDSTSLAKVMTLIRDLVNFYPAHIAKEDNHFFYPCLEYLTKSEQDNMMIEFWEFDRKLIHEKYQKVVEQARGMGE